jgi:hypothetical protein
MASLTEQMTQISLRERIFTLELTGEELAALLAAFAPSSVAGRNEYLQMNFRNAPSIKHIDLYDLYKKITAILPLYGK